MALETIAAVVTALLATALLAVLNRWLGAPRHKPMRCILTPPVEEWNRSPEPARRSGKILPFPRDPVSATRRHPLRHLSGRSR
jgi:hypothetical protein